MLDIKALLAKLVEHYNRIEVFDNDHTGNDSLGHAASWYYGTSISLSNASSATAALTSISGTKTFPKGSWVFFVSVRFPASATGIRGVQLYLGGSAVGASYVQKPAVTSNAMALTTSCRYNATSDFTFDIRARQNSGSAQNVDYYFQAVRLK